MRYICVHQRFLFFDGKTNYTVEYSNGLRRWYIFNDEERTNACYEGEVIKKRNLKVDLNLAFTVLQKFLELTQPPTT